MAVEMNAKRKIVIASEKDAELYDKCFSDIDESINLLYKRKNNNYNKKKKPTKRRVKV